VFPDRTYTIKAVELVVPTLDNVLDTGDKEVLEGGLTASATLKLNGTASKGQPVEIFDGRGASAVSKGTATANTTTGIWEHTITVPVGGRRLYAQSRYHPTPVYSNVRNLTVVAVIVPTLVNVLDANNVEVPEGTSTTSTTLKLKGKASNGKTVEIFDGSGPSAVSKGKATANATTGIWELTITVPAGARRLYAKSLYHSADTYSNVRTFTVETWVDSITNFNDGTSGKWLKGPAGFQGYITNGFFQNLTTAHSGHAGVLFSQTFTFEAGKTYSFSYQARNFARQVVDLAPSFSVQFASGQLILPVYSVPRTNQWYTQTANFSVAKTGNYSLQIMSHQNRGGGNNGDGGNDYDIDNIIVRLVK
jgi:hypothetical protein